MRSCRPVQALAAPDRAAIGAAGSALQWSFASAAAVPALETTEVDVGGGATDADAGGERGDTTDADAGGDAGDVAGDDSATTPDESAALRP